MTAARASKTATPAGLAALLDHERASRAQPLLEALLDQRSGDHPSEIRDAADRILRAHAPWAVDLDGRAEALIGRAGDDRSVRLFSGWALDGTASIAELARREGISAQLASYRLQRAAARVREATAATPPWAWLAATVRRRLGALTTTGALDELLARLGVTTGPESELAVWLAGPYLPVARRPGWMGLEPRAAAARTEKVLAADGGVRPLADVRAELADLEVTAELFVAWIGANGAAVVHDLAVLVTGQVADAVERILDAHGRDLSPEQIHADLAAGGRVVDRGALERAWRGARFTRSGTGRVGLSAWAGDAPAAKGQRSRRRRPADPARSDPARSAPPARPPAPAPGAEGRLWLWVKVDDDVLRGCEAPVPTALVEGVGMVAPARRTFSSRWGPVTLAHDGAHPTRGSVRAIALAAGANPDDTLLLGFSPAADVAVEVRRGPAQPEARDVHGAPLVLFPELESVHGGTTP